MEMTDVHVRVLATNLFFSICNLTALPVLRAKDWHHMSKVPNHEKVYVVTDWLAEKLIEQKEAVYVVDGIHFWACEESGPNLKDMSVFKKILESTNGRYPESL